jgi:hypothetical protein
LNCGAAIAVPHQLSVIDAASAPLPLILIKADPPQVEEFAALQFAGRYRIATRMHALTGRSWHATGCLPIERVAITSEDSAQRRRADPRAREHRCNG